MNNLLHVFLAGDMRMGRIDVERDYEITSRSSVDAGTAIINGADRPFRIVTDPRQLQGLRLSGFTLLPSGKYLPETKRREMMAAAGLLTRR